MTSTIGSTYADQGLVANIYFKIQLLEKLDQIYKSKALENENILA